LVLLFLAGGCAAPQRSDGPSFGVFGDIPYTDDEVHRVERLIDELNAEKLAFVVHVGDIGSSERACTDAWLLERKRQFARIRHPFVLLPGDNEWSDCRNPLERLGAWRKLFCPVGKELQVAVQDETYCEHIRWEAEGWVFVALNVPGSNNNLRHPEHAPRMAAVFAWLDEAAGLARGREGLVVLMQANPFVRAPRDGFVALRERLAQLGASMPGRVVLIHGDTHLYRFDEPLPGMRRVEVWGSPFVGWTRAYFGAGAFSIP
jgi:hypothetical protein